jgi:photosystem II stability/assembly factor-like uncharacterized protein
MKHLLSILLCLLVASSYAQNLQKPSTVEIQSLPLWAKKMYGDNPNVFEVDALYKAYYQQQTFVKNYHTQYYKRWKRSIVNRVDNNGFVMTLSSTELQAIQQEYLAKQSLEKTSNWSVVGPITNYQEGGTEGSGQTNVYSFDQCLGTPATMYCGTEPGEVYKTSDNGVNWTCVSAALDFGSGVTSVEVHFSNPNIVFAGGNNGVFRSTDGGNNWTNVLPESNFGVNEILINPANDQLVIAATDKGLYRSTDGGTNWTQLVNVACYDVKANVTNAATLYLVRDNPNEDLCEFYRSTDSGATWTIQTTGWHYSTDPGRNDGGARLAVTPADPNRVYAYLIGESKTGDTGYIGVYRSDDGGTSWTLPNGPAGGPYDANHMNLAIGSPDWQYHQGFYNCALMASATNANEILVGGLNVYRSTDGGTTFTSVSGYVPGPINMHVDNQDFRMLGTEAWITTDGGIYRSADFFNTQPTFTMSGVHGSDYWGFGSGWNEDVLVGGLYHNGNLAYYENYGDGNFLELGGGEASTGYVNPGNNRKTYFSDISGQIIPVNLNDPIGSAPFGMSPNESYWAAESSEMEFHPNCYNIAYIGNENSIWKTTDAGGSFNLLHAFGANANAKITYIEVSSSNPDVIYLHQQPTSGSTGTLWKTTDAGQTWNSITIPAGNSSRMLLAINPADENNLWMAYPSGSNGNKVYKTVNGGTSWTNITSATLNNESIQSLSHVAGTDGGIYAATNRAVYYRNTTNTWQIDNAGLPTYTSGNILRPFYRDGKMRMATYGKGIWESALNEAPTAVIARITVDKLQQTAVCSVDSFYFDDYSFMNHTNALWQWTFPTGSPASSTDRNPAVLFTTAGTHLAVLQITDGNGNTDTDSIYVDLNYYTLPFAPLSEDFQGNFLPNGWSLNNEDNGGQWSLSVAAGGFGNSNQSAIFDNYNIYGEGTTDDMVIPLNASGVMSELKLFFDVAYARWGSVNSDTLSILVSTDCGATYNELYYKGGTDLSTSPDFQDLFVPTAAQWRTDSVDLSAYIGESNLQIVFRNHGYYGNAMYIDNINIGSDLSLATSEITAISVFPNPVKAGGLLSIQTPKNAEIQLYDVNGKSIACYTGIGNCQIAIPAETQAGMYVLRIKTDTQIVNKRVEVLK